TQDLGTGTYTIMTQIAADELGLPVEQVRFELGDTALPETPVSGGSMTASSTGSAVKLACVELRRRVALLAIGDAGSPLFGVPLDAITVADGALIARGLATRKDPLVAILARHRLAQLEADHH